MGQQRGVERKKQLCRPVSPSSLAVFFVCRYGAGLVDKKLVECLTDSFGRLRRPGPSLPNSVPDPFLLVVNIPAKGEEE